MNHKRIQTNILRWIFGAPAGLCVVFPPGGSSTPENNLTLCRGRLLLTNQIAGYSTPDQSGVAVCGPFFKMHSLMRGGLRSQLLGRMSFSLSVNLVSVLVNMISVCCILALGLFSSALGRDFRGGENVSGLKRLQRGFNSDEVRRSLEKSDLWKRSSGLNEQTCTALPDIESTLQNSTNTVSQMLFKRVYMCSCVLVTDGGESCSVWLWWLTTWSRSWNPHCKQPPNVFTRQITNI